MSVCVCVCLSRALPLRRQELAATKLREHPTLPSDEAMDTVDMGELWPSVFCCFNGCDWQDAHGDEDALAMHLMDVHSEDLQPIASCMLRGNAPDACLSIYKAAISCKCRKQAPVAGCSIDRGALKAYSEAMKGENVESLICFSCARRFTYVAELVKEGKGDINWDQPVQFKNSKLSFLGKPAEKIAGLLSLDTFLERYDQISSRGTRLSDTESFEHWSLSLQDLPGHGRLLCCPEDRTDQIRNKKTSIF